MQTQNNYAVNQNSWRETSPEVANRLAENMSFSKWESVADEKGNVVGWKNKNSNEVVYQVQRPTS